MLLDNLGRVRREIGPIDAALSDAVADRMNIRRGEVHEVVSFYSFLGVPTDAVRVCIGPVCDCMGAKDVLAREQERAQGVPVLGVECLGHCDLAPVRMRGDRVEPEVEHRTNEGAVLRLHEPETAEYSVYRSLPSNERIVEELKAAGLAGYGGAGFPTGVKWEAVAREPAPRYVIVNADEGEPGTIKDRYVMELRPHLLLEGTLIAMRFAEATEGFIYLREEYARARASLDRALEEARAAGLLDGLSIRMVIGAGAYICGEETAMLESMEGRRGMPRLKPPFPSQVGYLGRPTLINNVETLAHVPVILRMGGAAWAALGMRGASGVRLWSLSGAVRRPGCYEAPNGITLRELIDEYAGGATDEIGAIVPGGAASGILPPAALDVPLTRDALREWGAGVGSAGVQIFPIRYPPLRLLAETMRFFAEESCQKCTPCRIGNRALHYLAEELENGRAAMPRRQVEEWLDAMVATSICGLGQGAPFPVRNAFRYWPELFAPLGEAEAA
ncbi:MAG: NAD(P)H-dependent oxidoreductase subunit E [Actinomycetota bacterium]|nr:NAD(P)H-dependent oxidoreductase subunit E [Actinomycetota bacterium]